MDESAIKGVELSGSDAENRKSRISRILVEGYDTSLPKADVEEALREHFASCGNITHVYVPADLKSGLVNSFSFLYLNGEVEEEALKLNGSNMGGHAVHTRAYPFHQKDLDDKLEHTIADEYVQRKLEITGFNTSLTKADIINALNDEYLSIQGVVVNRDYTSNIPCLKSTSYIYIAGHANIEQALELSGGRVKGFTTFVVTQVSPLFKRCPRGYTIPQRLYLGTLDRVESLALG